MAKVEIPIEVARKFTKGVTTHEVDASDLQDIVISLDKDFPGIKEALNTGLAVAIDSSILQDWFLEEVEQNSKVRFIPAIEGG
jgi:sulfur carrier protein ThiS